MQNDDRLDDDEFADDDLEETAELPGDDAPGTAGGELCWRDTYFVWFSSKRRPKLTEIERVLRALPDHYTLQFPEQDDSGNFESITLLSAGDHAALEISYLAGDDLREQAQALAEEVKQCDGSAAERLARLAKCDARFDVMQFEQIDADENEEEADELFDPSALLVVMGALAKLVDGIGVDPQSGLLV